MFDGDGNFQREIKIDVPFDPDAKPAIGNKPDLTNYLQTGGTFAPGAPWALCITPGPNQVLYSSDSYPGRIYKLSLDGKVLRDFTNTTGAWSVAEDYLYRDGQLFAGYLGTGQRRHFALDHLGTVRLATNTAGTPTDYHVYYPFGEEATPFDSNADHMQFTGHERDLNAQTGANPSADDLDYMHARHESPVTGRFLSVDPIGGSQQRPQSWNRYLFAYGIQRFTSTLTVLSLFRLTN